MSLSPPTLQCPIGLHMGSLGSAESPSSIESTNALPYPQDIPLFTSTCQSGNIAIHTPTGPQSVHIVLKPMVGRGFILSEGNWTSYRRNYFQISATYAIQRSAPVFGPDGAYSDDSPENTISSVLGLVAVTENGLMPVQNFSIGIASRCTDGTDSAPVDLIQRTAKRERGPKIIPSHIPCAPLPDVNMAPQDAPSGTVVVYERLQFRSTAISTTRRRLGKQFHMIAVQLWATLLDGTEVLVASTETAPLVVRSKSPRHYAEKMDLSDLNDSCASGTDSSSTSVHSMSPRLRKVGDSGWRGSSMAKTLTMQQMQQQIKQQQMQQYSQQFQNLQYQPYQQPPTHQHNLLQSHDDPSNQPGLISPAMSESYPQLSFMYSPMTPMAGEMPNNGSGIYAPSPQTATAISRFDTSSPQPGSQTLNRIGSPSPSNGSCPSPSPISTIFPLEWRDTSVAASPQQPSQLLPTQPLSMTNFDLLGMGNLALAHPNNPSLAQQDMLPMPVSNDQVGYGGHMAPLMYDMGDAVPS
ncbi:hypothetical protein BASA50_008244 [Batrachochytrium salamandrivorans]|uniref:NDT80 domain-containing protein n=1 Tax=Batrachochytrium salamandrivorans TaxID=1357716 RepID=A0ABQ8F521_9FUNG|nr:hypothetical protein BASA50_008244 [Batrachochytrium salamandrivorans]